MILKNSMETEMLKELLNSLKKKPLTLGLNQKTNNNNKDKNKNNNNNNKNKKMIKEMIYDSNLFKIIN